MSTPTHFWRLRRRAVRPAAVVGAGGLLTLVLAQVVTVRNAVEDDLEARAAAALVGAGIAADVRFSGRDGVLDVPGGTAADDVEEAVATVRRVTGVRAVQVRAGDGTASGPTPGAPAGPTTRPTAGPTAGPTGAPTTAPPTTPPTGPGTTPGPTSTGSSAPGTSAAGPLVVLTRTGSGVDLSGVVADEDSRRRVVEAATRAYSPAGVAARLGVDDERADDRGDDQGLDGDGGIAPLLSFLAASGGAGGAPPLVRLEGGVLTLGGDVRSPQRADALRAAALRAAGGAAGVQDRLTVGSSPAPGATPEPTAAPTPGPTPTPTPTPGTGRATDGAHLDALPDVRFAPASSHLTPRGHEIVARAAAVLREDPALRVLVEGHADSVGRSATVLAVSRDRALAVERALVALGVGADRIDTVAYGDSRPKRDPEVTADDRAANRRVVLRALS